MKNKLEILKGIPSGVFMEKELGYDEGFLMSLQLHHDIKILRLKESAGYKPDLSKFQKVIFWRY